MEITKIPTKSDLVAFSDETQKIIQDKCCPKCKSKEGYLELSLNTETTAYNFDGSTWGESTSSWIKIYKTVECIECNHRWKAKLMRDL